MFDGATLLYQARQNQSLSCVEGQQRVRVEKKIKFWVTVFFFSHLTVRGPRGSLYLHYQTPQTWYKNSSGSYTCVRRLFQLTWQVNLTSYNLSSELKSGKRARWQVNLSSQLVKLTSLSSGTCHRKWDLSSTKKNLESLARRRRCLRDFPVLFLRVLVCLKAVFSDGQDVKYDRDVTPPPTSFSR